MADTSTQLDFSLIKNHFEKDTHIEIQGKPIERIHVLHGSTPKQDVIVVIYRGIPHLTFYNYKGRVLDIDHYLPTNYAQFDRKAHSAIKQNLNNYSSIDGGSKSGLKELLKKIFKSGNKDFRLGLEKQHGFFLSPSAETIFFKELGFSALAGNLSSFLNKRFETFDDLLDALIRARHLSRNGYVSITPSGNIAISSLNKGSGIAVLIETHNADGTRLPVNQWNITRTDSAELFEQALIFRSPDLQALFQHDAHRSAFRTERYLLMHREGSLMIDSLLDDTDNLYETPLYQDCYQILSSDRNMVLALAAERKLTIINAHLSIIPHKWVKDIVLPYAVEWIRVDANVSTAFAMKKDGQIVALNITGSHADEISELGIYEGEFQLDSSGNIVTLSKNGKLEFIKTNVANLELAEEQKDLHAVIESLGNLFKGEQLFTKAQYAKPINERPSIEEDILPEVIANAKYDFESNIDFMMVNAGNDYQKYLEIQQKIAIARTNITEQLVARAEERDVLLAGQRLNAIVDSIVQGAEKKVRNIIEKLRAQEILKESKAYHSDLQKMSNPADFRTVLHTLRLHELELASMLDENITGVFSEFKEIQKLLNTSFADQISKDGTALQNFVTKEIEEIEKAIAETYDIKKLETLLNVHPAALELFSLLKQPYILQSLASEHALSPSGIQRRLYNVADDKRKELKEEEEKSQALKIAAKLQLGEMVRTAIDQFVDNHTGGFSEILISENANYHRVMSDIGKIESEYADTRLAMELRRLLERRILERNRSDLDKLVTFEGKYAFIQNDPDLFVDLDTTLVSFATWSLDLVERPGNDAYGVIFIRDADKEVYRPSTKDNLDAGGAFVISSSEYPAFIDQYKKYNNPENGFTYIRAIYEVHHKIKPIEAFAQFSKETIKEDLPKKGAAEKALRCALEKKQRDHLERNRKRSVPVISPEFIDETPYFQQKLQEFIIKAKLQLVTGSGIILLSGPPSTGKSAFLKFISAIMNREYFEHASDKWQTKNSLVTAIKFGEQGPYSVPAGFTKAITTPFSLVNIEEIKEWPEALRKSLNPFFAGSKVFIAPDGSKYAIGDNILLCAAANLGAMYRQEDEPFTADFWSRIEVVEYNYAPEIVSTDYFTELSKHNKDNHLTIQSLVKSFFFLDEAPDNPDDRARYMATQFLEFILLPKADEAIKRENLQNHIRDYFSNNNKLEQGYIYSPEEAAKIALRRMMTLQQYSPIEFYHMYNHFVNQKAIELPYLAEMQANDIERYEHLNVIFLTLHHLEGGLRHLRSIFHSTAGQTEIEGTNREFIKAVYLLGLVT